MFMQVKGPRVSLLAKSFVVASQPQSQSSMQVQHRVLAFSPHQR